MNQTLEQIVETGYKIRNPFKIIDDYVIVYAYSIKNDIVEEILLDYEFWLKHKELYYSVSQTHGAVCTVYNKKRTMLHRLVTNVHEVDWNNGEVVVDHLNHNNRDNRIKNLRVVNTQINNRNRRLFNNNKLGIWGIDLKDGLYRVRLSKMDGTPIEKLFKELKPAFIFNYKSRLEEGYLFEESSTTIENYIETL